MKPLTFLDHLRYWFRDTSGGRLALKIGVFVILYVSLGATGVAILFSWGVNPTLLMSVFSAPLWIMLVLFCWRVARLLVEGKHL